jgi:HEAT repeat protein
LADLVILTGDSADFDFLLDAIQDTDPRVAEAAVFNLGRVAVDRPDVRESVVRSLEETALSDRNHIVRVSALRGLNLIFPGSSHPWLLDLAADYDEDLPVRVASLQAIRLRGVDLAPGEVVLIERLANHHNPHLARAAAQVLENYHND